MVTGNSPTCEVICAEIPYWDNNRLIFPFLINNWQHFYNLEFPPEFQLTQKYPPSVLIGIAIAEIYRLCEICTPKTVQVPWYKCKSWEADWWNEDIYWYLQQKFYLEQWSWDKMPKIEFSSDSNNSLENSWSPSVSDSYLLAVSGGKESTFSYSLIEAATNRNFAIDVVGEDLLILEELAELWRSLFDPSVEKPFECVGEKRETLMALVKCKQQRLNNEEPLGILANIPDVEFDNSLLRVSSPHNIPKSHRDKLDAVTTKTDFKNQ